MARTTTKEISFFIENPTEQEAFLKEVKKKIKFIDLQISFKHQKINITLRGARERVLYAMSMIKKIRENIGFAS
ncbi:MAG: hypothetical protein ACTSRW_00820 [Candidatus Helarchaeota archaeon]